MELEGLVLQLGVVMGVIAMSSTGAVSVAADKLIASICESITHAFDGFTAPGLVVSALCLSLPLPLPLSVTAVMDKGASRCRG